MSETTEAKTVRIDFVSDVVCPWCIIGYKQLQAALDATGIKGEIHWWPFELNPLMAEEGEHLQEHLAAKYGTTPDGSAKARERLTTLGAELGFTFNYADDMRMVNTWRAHQLLAWAEDQGRKHELKLSLFEAFFTRRENINDLEVLVGVAQSLDLDGEAARAALEDERYADQVREEERLWSERGIQGVPAVILNQRYLLTGAQGAERFAAALQQVANESDAA
ncbi:MAG: DsbA family oxidoreductase [Bradymonadia bacterium]